MRKVGFIWLGHADYLDTITKGIQDETVTAVQGSPFFDARKSNIVTNDEEAIHAVRELMYTQNCCGAVIVLTSWIECNVAMSAIKELRGLPCMLWGTPVDRGAGENVGSGSYVSASMMNGVVKRMGIACPVLIEGTKVPGIGEKLTNFAAAACAADELFYARIGLFGYTSMSIYPGTFDHVLMRYRIGPEVEQMDSYSLIRCAEAAPEAAVEDAMRRVRTLSNVRNDVQEDVFKKTMALYVAMSELTREHQWKAINVKCQYEFSKEYKVVPCVALSLLAEDGLTVSCEGDIPNTVSMMILQSLSGEMVWYGDSLTHTGNVVQFSPCGYMPFTMANGTPYVQKFMEHPGFSGIQVSGVMRPEKVTFMRLVEDIGDYHLVYGTGEGIETLPRGGCMPALNVRLDGDIQKLLKLYAGQHYAIAYGDLSERIETFAEIMKIRCCKV